MKALACLIAVMLLAAACSERTPPETAMPPRLTSEQLAAQRASIAPSRLPNGSCVSDELIKAEQFIRLHTELMVTGLTCAHSYNDPELFGNYQVFTAAHADRIRQVQTDLGRFLGQNQRGSNARLFDTYRTEMANDESQVVIAVTHDGYCQAQREAFYTVARLNPQDLDAYLSQVAERSRDTYRTCSASR